MSMTLPWARGRGAHRSASPAQLREENRILLARSVAADDYFARLTEDRDQVHATWQEELGRRIDAEQVVACQDARIRELEAELANATAVHVPVGQRDITPGDEATQPIPAGQHWSNPARTHSGHVVPRPALGQAQRRLRPPAPPDDTGRRAQAH